MSERADLVDWIAAALFALASVELGLWGFWMMLSLIALPLGLVVGTLIWLPEILLRVRFGVVLANEELAFSVLGLFLLVYLVLRRDRYGIGRRLPASMTLGYTAEKTK